MESAIAELVHTHAVVEVPFIPHVVQGFLPSAVTKIHSLVQTGLTARFWRSELALRGLSFFKPSGFMLAHVFLFRLSVHL